MSRFTDKFLGILKLNEEYDEDYDDYDDEDYDDYDNQPAKKVNNKLSIEKDFSVAKNYKEKLPEPQKNSKANAFKNNSKVVPMRNNKTSMEVCVIKPTNVDEAREITDTLLSGRAVVLNLEGLNVDIAQRIIDFTSGSCYSINGNLQKVSNYIFIITPESVDISGDFQGLIDGGFDVATFK